MDGQPGAHPQRGRQEGGQHRGAELGQGQADGDHGHEAVGATVDRGATVDGGPARRRAVEPDHRATYRPE